VREGSADVARNPPMVAKAGVHPTSMTGAIGISSG
jgi:hypothetical protein